MALANWRNCGQSFPGTTTWRNPSIVGAVREREKKSKTVGHSLPKQTSELAALGEQCQISGVPTTAGSKWGSHPNGRRERAEKALLQTLTTAIGSMLFQEKRRCFNHSSEGKEKLLLKFLSYSGIIVRGNPAKYKGRNPESFRV